MKDILANIFGKFNSYEIFGNFIPGAAFCLIYRFFYDDIDWNEIEIFERILIYYLMGIVAGRIGEIFTSIKKKSAPNLENQEYLNYVWVSESKPFIRILHETSICYRALVGTFICHLIIYILKFFENFSCVFLYSSIVRVIALILGIILFWYSNSKQEEVVKERVRFYMNSSSDN